MEANERTSKAIFDKINKYRLKSNMEYNERSALLSLEKSYSIETSLDCSANWKNYTTKQKNNKGDGASWFTGTFLLVNAALGAGLLNYPVAYDRLGGIGFATFVQIIMCLILASTMIILVYCADLTGVNTYHEVLERMCGRRVKQAAALSILITCFGICVTFLIIIGDQFDRIFATFFGTQFCYRFYLNRIFTIVLTTVCTIWPMSYFKRLDFLKHANFLGVFATLYVIFLNVYEYYKLDVVPGPIKNYPDNIMGFLAALPVVCFAYQTHEIVVPVYACLAERNTRNFAKVTGFTLSLLFVLYCISGTYGYLTFGGTVAPDVMQMYSPSDPIVSAGIVALIVKMITTYPPVIFCGRDTFIGLFCKKPEPLPMGQTSDVSEFRNRVMITSVWNLTVLILALVTPNITIAIGFLGSLAACNVFLFPGFCMISLSRRMIASNNNEESGQCLPKVLFFYGVFIIITSIFMFFVILLQVINDLTGEDTHQPLCI